ncbi:MAG TPA: multicopper oxidase domain-containing protein [Acidimicrobiales bacterium]|nr:multicopper oxidase domain-containing protein [Acidimicrobiales bacterium]
MTEPNEPTADDTGVDLDTTGEDDVRSQQRRKLRDRMSDVGLIATMAFATIVAVGAVLAWALFTGDGQKGDLSSGAAKATTKTMDVSLGEFWVKPASVDISANTTLILNVTNDGAQTHDLKIGSKQTPILNPGEKAVLKTTAIEATVQGYCTLPGHQAAGMVMDINVVGAGGAETQQVSQGAANTGIGEGINPDDAEIDKSAEPEKGFKAADPVLEPAPGGTVHDVTFEATDKDIEVAPGVTQKIWAFNGTVPGPTLRGKVGDVFNVKLVNKGSIGHSLDFHASQTSMDVDMRTIQPGESLMYSFKAEYAGAWMWHCGTPPVLHHIANGMYGAVIIDPADGLAPVDHELLMVQSELYLGPEGQEADLKKAEWGFADAVVFNGYFNQYVYDPIAVKVGERVRVWVENVGPNEISAFHIVGTQFDTVFKEGAYTLQPDNPQSGGSQALDLMPSQGGFVEFTVPKKGKYAMVTHKFNDAERGATGLIVAE